MNLLQIRSKPAENKSKEDISRQNNKQSNKQFLTIIEKRIRKHLRTKDILKKDQTIYVLDSLTMFFLRRIATLPINIIKLSQEKLTIKEYDYNIFTNKEVKLFRKKMKKDETLFLPLLMDDYCAVFLKSHFTNKQLKKQDLQSLFETITYEEIKFIIEKFKLKVSFNRKDDLYQLLDNLELKFNGTKHALYNSLQFYNKNLI